MSSGSGRKGENVVPSTREKLISCVISMWSSQAQALSVRGVAKASGFPPSVIYYHFGTFERLLDAAQAQSLAEAERWCARRLDELGSTEAEPSGAVGLGTAFAVLTDIWCEEERLSAFAWREAQIAAMRTPAARDVAARWHSLWLGFWTEICKRAGLAEWAIPTAALFDGIGLLQIMRTGSALDRVTLHEVGRAWSRWMEGRLSPPSPWLELCRARVLEAERARASPELDEPTAAAAARVVARLGPAGLTHRAVAAEAGMTLGMVSYRLRTSADLLGAAFEHVYRGLLLGSASEGKAGEIGQDVALARVMQTTVDSAAMLATTELMLASARDESFAVLAPQLRYLRGRSSGRYLTAVLGRAEPVAAMDAYLFSCVQAGYARAAACGLMPREGPGDAWSVLGALIMHIAPAS